MYDLTLGTVCATDCSPYGSPGFHCLQNSSPVNPVGVLQKFSLGNRPPPCQIFEMGPVLWLGILSGTTQMS